MTAGAGAFAAACRAAIRRIKSPARLGVQNVIAQLELTVGLVEGRRG